MTEINIFTQSAVLNGTWYIRPEIVVSAPEAQLFSRTLWYSKKYIASDRKLEFSSHIVPVIFSFRDRDPIFAFLWLSAAIAFFLNIKTLFKCTMKMWLIKLKTIVGTVPKYDRQIAETETKSKSLTQYLKSNQQWIH